MWAGFVDIIAEVSRYIFWINMLLGLILVFFERRNTGTLWAWLLLMFFVPIAGFLFYLYFGQDLRKTKMFKAKQVEDMIQIAELQKKRIDDKTRNPLPQYEQYMDTARMLLDSGQAVISDNNYVDIFTDGEDKFTSLMADLRQAKEYIYIQYYIFRGDELGKQIMDILCQKAQEGLEVRLLTDGMGSMGEKKAFFQRLRQAGGRVTVFYPPFVPYINFRINYRNHRKLVVIDGNIGYVGGFNVGDEYLGKGKLGYWRDTHLRIQGSAVDDMEMRFLLDWNYASPSKIRRDRFYGRDRSGEEYIPAIRKIPGAHPKFSHVVMQIVSSGPDSAWQNIRNGYLKLITEAEKKIYIETPYLVLDDVLLENLRIAALSGLDVRVIIPNKADHMMLDGANMSYVGDLLEAGARCYTYQNGFIHSKSIIVDDVLCSVGTANMDIRSFKLDFEVNAFIYNPELTAELTRCFMKDLELSQEITVEAYKRRSLWMRFKESVMRLVSPLL
ncbi:MAG: cardiolipin synthase [Lachnospiraceae bacterium]|jgi:cardiolipin synthase|nr:cardiolipin synthase [Lachnospiraceae bacterium]